MVFIPALLLLPTLLYITTFTNAQKIRPSFLDVSVAAGMLRPYGKRIKYGGPAVADLNGDGYPDLIFGHHDENLTDLYINKGDGSFSFSHADWKLRADIHGISPFRFSTAQSSMHFTMSRGGNRGTKPNYPFLFFVNSSKTVTEVDVTNAGLVPQSSGRGRSALYVNMDRTKPECNGVIFTNAILENVPDPNRAFELSEEEKFEFKHLTGGFENDTNAYMSVVDIDNDGFMEIINFQHLRAYIISDGYHVSEITHTIFPRELERRGVSAAVEIDFDNDGLMDLFVTRTDSGHLDWRNLGNGKEGRDDLLLRNIGGKYVDVTTSAGIPIDTQSQGVTAGDFDNDGWVDLLVIRFGNNPDLLLHNNGDGTFAVRNAGLKRERNVSGDMAAAVDLDRDGRLDLVVSEGDWHDKSLNGYYRLMRNVTPGIGNFLLIRVRNAPSGRVTSLHAVANVKWKNGKTLTRRVGSTGTAVSVSYIELLHFGVGDVDVLEQVSVRWVGGETDTKEDVAVNQLLTFGI